MTVKELIEELQCYEQDKKVWISVGDKDILVTRVDLDDNDDLVIG